MIVTEQHLDINNPLQRAVLKIKMLKYYGIYESIETFHRKTAQTNLTSLCIIRKASHSLYWKEQSATLEKSMTEIKGKWRIIWTEDLVLKE